MPDISVIVCTHNPRRDYLDRTLAALAAQTFRKDRWDLLLVDNASQEPLRCELSWHARARQVGEATLGLASVSADRSRTHIGSSFNAWESFPFSIEREKSCSAAVTISFHGSDLPPVSASASFRSCA